MCEGKFVLTSPDEKNVWGGKSFDGEMSVCVCVCIFPVGGRIRTPQDSTQENKHYNSLLKLGVQFYFIW